MTRVRFRQPAVAWLASRLIPARCRQAHWLASRLLIMWWLPCSTCGQMFGGHEWRAVAGQSPAVWEHQGGARVVHGSVIVRAAVLRPICPACTRRGAGDGDAAALADPGRREDPEYLPDTRLSRLALRWFAAAGLVAVGVIGCELVGMYHPSGPQKMVHSAVIWGLDLLGAVPLFQSFRLRRRRRIIADPEPRIRWGPMPWPMRQVTRIVQHLCSRPRR